MIHGLTVSSALIGCIIGGIGVGLASAVAPMYIGEIAPPMMEVSGAKTYGIYGVMSILSALFVWKFIPKTKGKSLEELEMLLKKSQNMKKADSQ